MLDALLLLHSSEEQPKPPMAQTEMQRILMQKFFYDMKYSFIDEASQKDPKRDICAPWHGIQCEGGLVRSIKYAYANFGNFNLIFVPQTVEALELYQCAQAYTVRSELLPRDSLSVSLRRNLIHGTIELTTLPEKIRIFNVSNNKIVGPINLMWLPRALEKLSVSCNNIHQDIVYYAKLPPNITQIHLRGAFGNNRVRRVQAAAPEHKCISKKIFVDVLPREVD